jgi:hypothetical protein
MSPSWMVTRETGSGYMWPLAGEKELNIAVQFEL